MIKTIYINENQPVEVNSSAGWLLIYKQTFGRDILPDLMPVLEAIFNGLAEIFENADDDLTAKGIFHAMSEGALSSALFSLSGMEVITVLQIIWALNKNADNSITNNLIEWANGFDKMELDNVIPQIVELIGESSASSKNWISLREKVQQAKQTKR